MKANKIIGLQSVNVREQRLKRERNVLKMCIAIVLVFVVCWVPFSIWWLLFLCSSDRTISSCGFQFFGVIAVFLKMCIAIALVFVVCWVPFSIWWLLFLCSSDRTISSCGFQFFGVIAVFLRRSNCAVNPYICFIFSVNYRQGLKYLFSCFSVGQTLNQIAPWFDSQAIVLNYSRPQRD